VVAGTRRGFLGALAALAVAGCGDRTPPAPPGGDAGVLGRLLATEEELATAWEGLAAHRAIAGPIAARERANVAALRAAGAAEQRASTGVRADLEALLAAERAAATACVDALVRLRRPAARGVAFDVSVTHAAHVAAALAALGRDPLPDAFAGVKA
jgi:hypothetical protein